MATRLFRLLALFLLCFSVFTPARSFGLAFDGTAATWTGGNVYYTFSSSGTNAVPANFQKAFLDAATEWSTFANLHFIPRTTQTNYVTVQVLSGLEGGQATLGMAGGQQFLSVSPNAWNHGTLCHEIGHLLGLIHEQQRSDRGSNVVILTNNIVTNGLSNFTVATNSQNKGTYDFLSVMHYARNYLSTATNLDTIVPLPAFTNFINLMGVPSPILLSIGDRAGMAAVYGTAPTNSSVVTNTSDSGPGSLRAGLYYAYDHPGTHITFNIATNDTGYSNGVFNLQPTDQLPWLVNATFLDASSQPTNATSNTNGPLVRLNGSLTPSLNPGANGLRFGGTNCTARGLVINGYPSSGILLTGTNTTSNTVAGCYLSTDPSGTLAVSNVLPGITISAGANGNTIGGTNVASRNLISGSGIQGMVIRDPGTTNNIVIGNFIGLNAAGTASLSNFFAGIEIFNGAARNIIGGTSAASRNIISGNHLQGILISDTNTVGNIVEGNYLGLNAAGNVAVANGFSGIQLAAGVQANTVGGTAVGAGNVISGNTIQGVALTDAGTTGNVVAGNFIGLSAVGTNAIPNGGRGVELFSNASGNFIGGLVPGAGNVISGNASQGISFEGAGTVSNFVQGNFIGLNATGVVAVPNTGGGIGVFASSSGNFISGNVISGNSAPGIDLQDSGTSNNVVQGNYIGLNAAGTAAVPNTSSGIGIFNGTTSNLIGGIIPGAGNVISGNGAQGIDLQDSGTSRNVIQGNLIGLNAAGTAAVPNATHGIEILLSASTNTIGGPGGRNFISGNNNNGVLIDNNAFANIIQGNTIGLNLFNNAPLPNVQAGVGMFIGARSNTIGGVTLGAANLIAGNGSYGIVLFDSSSSGNILRGNSVYSNGSGGISLFTGANNSGSESAPTLTTAVVTTNTTISGSLNSLASTTFHLDFYANQAASIQGRTWLGTKDVTTSGAGSVSFASGISATVPIGQIITATATDPSGNTSSLSSGVTVSATDSVGDGIPNAWRAAHFGGGGTATNSSSCANCDPDHDGMNNRQEFLTGTDPNIAASVFTMETPTMAAPNVNVSFPSVSGFTYRVESRPDVLAGGWTIMADQILGTGTNIQIPDFGAASLPRRFYRAAVLP